jgi:hypothetical protein
VDVLEHQHRRLVCGHRLNETANREEQAVPVCDRRRWIEAEDDPEMPGDLLVMRRLQQGGDCIVELLQCSVDAVGLEDPA